MKKLQGYLQLIIIVAIIILINVIAQYFHGYIDLTEEKRYTLSESTIRVTEGVDDILFIRVLLDGDFPAGFKRLQQATEELLEDLNDINPNIQYIFEDPSEGTVDDIKSRREQLAKDGIVPTNLNYFDGKEYVQKGIYPYALISYKGRFSAVSLLQEQGAGQDENEVLNKSVELLEYKFANMFQKIQDGARKNILILSGHDELPPVKTIRLESDLSQYYNIGRLDLDTLAFIPEQVDLILAMSPKKPFSEQEKFKIDQYVMNGGKVIWMIDKMDVTLDSINKHRFYIPNVHDLNIDDLLFKYGVRIQPNLILDLESSSIPQIVGQQGGKAQTALFKWYYHPLATPQGTHPIVKNIGRVNTQFPSTIDTLRTSTPVQKTVLLASSDYSRMQLLPTRLNFEILKSAPETDKFNKGSQPIAVLLEGRFPSLFKNRMTQDFVKNYEQLDRKVKDESVETKQMVISDADFAKNVLNYQTQQAEPIGYNSWDRKFYEGNRAFILNAVEFMLDKSGVLESRSKDIKLRLLDKVRTEKEATKWQIINIVLPILFILIFGLLYGFVRRKRYGN